MTAAFEIAGRPIGPDHPPYIIAEMSANHLGSFERALAIMDAAKAAGVDAVKLQTYTADTITLNVDRGEFAITDGPWAGHTLHNLYESAATPWEWHADLFAHGRKLGLPVFSSPFDLTAVDLLRSLDAPAYKIASFELLDLELVETCARTGRPLIMSTGNADDEEIGEALEAARTAGARDICLLHCVSGYPTPPEEANLRRITHLATTFGVPVGLSDHSHGAFLPVAATALGMRVVEKHLTLARADGGPDAFFSLEPAEFKDVVEGTRQAWQALRRLTLAPQPSELASRAHRRSLYAAADIKAGEPLTSANVRSVRPGNGLKPKYLKVVLGRRAARDIPYGTPLSWDLLEDA